MRVLIAALSVILAVSAYDAVYFSTQRDIKSQTLEDIVSSASTEEPVVFIVNPDFTLGQFSVKANAYSSEAIDDYLAKLVKSSKSYGSQYFADQFIIPAANIITSASEFTTGSSVYILAGEEWTSAEELAQQVLAKVDNAAVILTSTDAVVKEQTRVKRLTIQNDAVSRDAVSTLPLPVVLPPYNVSGTTVSPSNENSCLFYLEGLNIVVSKTDASKTTTYSAASIRYSNATWTTDTDYYKCANGSVGEYIFRVSLTTSNEISDSGNMFKIPANTAIDVTLNITGTKDGYWKLVGATLHSASVNMNSGGAATASEVVVGEGATRFTGINSVAGFALACSQSQAIFFQSSSADVRIGVSLHNAQIQTYVVNSDWLTWAYFTRQTEDCTGTFSAGSWMGLLSALVLITGLLFGYLMLQSVQSQDRYDDPKQKQIVINVRE